MYNSLQCLGMDRQIDLINNAYVGDGKKKEKEEDHNQRKEEIGADQIFHLTDALSRLYGDLKQTKKKKDHNQRKGEMSADQIFNLTDENTLCTGTWTRLERVTLIPNIPVARE